MLMDQEWEGEKRRGKGLLRKTKIKTIPKLTMTLIVSKLTQKWTTNL
jgi:hypothetical protein